MALSRRQILRAAHHIASPRRLYLVAPDPMAGHTERYTLYLIRLDTKRTRIIGRELDIESCEQVIKTREARHAPIPRKAKR